MDLSYELWEAPWEGIEPIVLSGTKEGFEVAMKERQKTQRMILNCTFIEHWPIDYELERLSEVLNFELDDLTVCDDIMFVVDGGTSKSFRKLADTVFKCLPLTTKVWLR